ncbi:hypothetical protein ACPPVT_05655 [Angustibacter sp. McL0619]|uniref:hypothetical protein n=1 Tax=Angustibacter sp. McL0619 TaxID=3415676 RepID=UPI003CF18CAB
MSSDENPGVGDDPGARGDARADVLFWRRLASLLMGLQALALGAVALWALALLVIGGSSTVQNDALLGILLAVGALGVGFVARELLRGHSRVRTAALFWQVLLLLLVPSIWHAGNQVLAVGVLVLAVATGVTVVAATSSRA